MKNHKQNKLNIKKITILSALLLMSPTTLLFAQDTTSTGTQASVYSQTASGQISVSIKPGQTSTATTTTTTTPVSNPTTQVVSNPVTDVKKVVDTPTTQNQNTHLTTNPVQTFEVSQPSGFISSFALPDLTPRLMPLSSNGRKFPNIADVGTMNYNTPNSFANFYNSYLPTNGKIGAITDEKTINAFWSRPENKALYKILVAKYGKNNGYLLVFQKLKGAKKVNWDLMKQFSDPEQLRKYLENSSLSVVANNSEAVGLVRGTNTSTKLNFIIIILNIFLIILPTLCLKILNINIKQKKS